jgi:hypothetical protein
MYFIIIFALMWQLRCLGPGEPRAWGGKGGTAVPPLAALQLPIWGKNIL